MAINAIASARDSLHGFQYITITKCFHTQYYHCIHYLWDFRQYSEKMGNDGERKRERESVCSFLGRKKIFFGLNGGAMHTKINKHIYEIGSLKNNDSDVTVGARFSIASSEWRSQQWFRLFANSHKHTFEPSQIGQIIFCLSLDFLFFMRACVCERV